MQRLNRSSCALALLIPVILLCGCASRRAGEEEAKNIRPAGRFTDRTYAKARNQWARLNTADLDQSARREGLREVLRSLDDAAVNEPMNPLLQSKRGDVFLELNEGEAAIAAFSEAIRLCPDWPPAWYGLGQALYFAQDKPVGWQDDVRAALKAADWGLTNMSRWGEVEPPSSIEALGSRLLGINLSSGSTARAVDDLGLDPFEARTLAFSWLDESLAWSADNPAILGGISPPRLRNSSSRMRSRIAYLGAMVDYDAPDTRKAGLAGLLSGLDQALGHDSDCFEARLAKAWALLAVDRNEEARALLEPMTDEANPMLAHHEPLLTLVARCYLNLLVEEPNERAMDRAAGFFRWLDREKNAAPPDSVWAPIRRYITALDSGDQASTRSAHRALSAFPIKDPAQVALVRGLLGLRLKIRATRETAGLGKGVNHD